MRNSKTRRFTWSNFSKDFITAILKSDKSKKYLKNDVDFDEDVEMLCTEMDKICTYPDNQFVKDYRREIEDYFLSGSNNLRRICESFEKRNYGGVKAGTAEEMLSELKEKRMVASIKEAYLRELRAYGRRQIPEDDFSYAMEKTIDVKESQFKGIPMERFQEEAVSALDNFFNKEGGKEGILMLPTGGGKTRVATVFLIKYMLSQGYQIIWLTHRYMLIDQAADNLYKISPMVAQENEDIEEVKLLCISGQHSGMVAFRKDDDMVVSSVRSMCIKKNYIPDNLKEKVMIVVDEAHHAVAPSYKKIIETIRKERPDAKLLGLTATPIRGTDQETAKLKKLFNNKVIYSKDTNELIASGFLSTPDYNSVLTHEDVESYMVKEDYTYIDKWGEMPDSLIRKVAESNKRNDLIVQEYVENKEKYGKTLVFALNGYHCIALNDKFREAGVKSDYIYTLNKDNDEKIEKFKAGELDVLININILTEGADVPDIRTVFLTRPTSSETLLMQMVGRGLRGVASGGTERVNIVDFCDKWTTINKWLNPQTVLEGFAMQEDAAPDEEPKKYEQKPFYLIPAEMISDIAKMISYKGGSVRYGYALPVGWYNIFDTYGNDRKVLVFENQLKPYEKMKRMQDRIIRDKTIDGRWVFYKCFTGMELAPPEEDIEDLIEYIRKAEEFPELITFEERKEIEPYIVAEAVRSENIPINSLGPQLKGIYDQHKALIDSIYGDYKEYKFRVLDWLASDGAEKPIGSIVEEAELISPGISEKPFPESLDDLLDEVIEEMKDQFPKSFKRPTITWSNVTYKNSFADYFSKENSIRVHTCLNFENVPREVLKYLIYHECLHYEDMTHGESFKAKEHKYPQHQNWDHWLDYQFPDYVRN